MKSKIATLLIITNTLCIAQVSPKVKMRIEQMTNDIESKMIAWRRDIHEHPELSNREVRTSNKVAEHLKSLGIEVTTNIAHTGVVGILTGSKPGPVVALRADMDALPITETTNIPFASKERGVYNGVETGIMHACGHDGHTAILMAVAEILAKNKSELNGTVKFIFQPAEEGPPEGEEGGAKLMIKEGVLDQPKVDVIFGLHVLQEQPVGTIKYISGGAFAASDRLRITVTGKQSHGGLPWKGVDPIVASAYIITALQTIISRSIDLTDAPSVVTIATIQGGLRRNIIPESVEMNGTIRTLNIEMREQVHQLIKRIAENTAEGLGAKAIVEINASGSTVLYNDPKLTNWATPILQRTIGQDNILDMNPRTSSDDFAFFSQKVPGLYFYLGVMPKDGDPTKTADSHTPNFYLDESGLRTGVIALTTLTLEYLSKK